MPTLDSIDVRNKRALIRVDFDVPLTDDRRILDDSRMRAALPTLLHVLDRGGACVLIAHLGRPGGERVPRLGLAAIASHLADLLPGHPVRFCPETIGATAQQTAEALPAGAVLLMENVRFHHGEMQGDEAFARDLAQLGEVYINDAFSECHRRYASVYGVAKQFDAGRRATGLLVECEVRALARVVEAPAAPVVTIFGGADFAAKIGAVSALVDRADRILIGGAMSYTFMKALDQPVGDSAVDEDQIETARAILERAADRLWLPTDHVVARSRGPASGSNLARDGIADGWSGCDIGPETIGRYRNEIARAATLIWNGPMGRIERTEYAEGTRRIAEAIAETAEERDAFTVAGGSDTGHMVRLLGLGGSVAHLSTGGGAFLHFIAHGTLPALEILQTV